MIMPMVHALAARAIVIPCPRRRQRRTALRLAGLALLVPAAAAPQTSLTALPTRSVRLELSLGAFDDPVLAFSKVSDLTVDGDQRLYVLQPVERMITVLEPDGTLHRRIGRKGQGPGEFLAPAAMGWRADTLWVMDPAQQRISWFYGGRHVRTSRFVPVRADRNGRIAAQWPMADGSTFTLLSRDFEEAPGRPENNFPVIRTAADGNTERTVAALRESFPFRLVIHHSEGTSRGSPLFSDFPLQGTDDSGSRTAILARPFGEGSEAEVRLTTLDAAGDTTFSRTYAVDVEPLTDQQWDARIREALAGVRRPDRPYGIREVEEASRRPAHWPSATRVVVGSDLSTWIELGSLPAESERAWAVVSDEGVPLFKVTLPRGFQLYSASGDALWGVWKDELDVPYVRRYRIDGASD